MLFPPLGMPCHALSTPWDALLCFVHPLGCPVMLCPPLGLPCHALSTPWEAPGPDICKVGSFGTGAGGQRGLDASQCISQL